MSKGTRKLQPGGATVEVTAHADINTLTSMCLRALHKKADPDNETLDEQHARIAAGFAAEEQLREIAAAEAVVAGDADFAAAFQMREEMEAAEAAVSGDADFAAAFQMHEEMETAEAAVAGDADVVGDADDAFVIAVADEDTVEVSGEHIVQKRSRECIEDNTSEASAAQTADEKRMRSDTQDPKYLMGF